MKETDILRQSVRKEFDKNGVVVVKNALTAAEIGQLRQILLRKFASEFAADWVEEQCGKHIPNAVSCCPELMWLYCHPSIVASIKNVLGAEDLVFIGNSDLHMNKLGGWHKDLGAEGRYLSEGSAANDEFKICKVGVYLQDEDTNDNGFKVQLGSHLIDSLCHDSPTKIDTRVGDVSLFDIRTTHTAMQPDFVEKSIRKLSYAGGKRGLKLARLMKETYWSLRGKPQRLSIFFTYGIRNAITEEFHNSVTKTPLSRFAANNESYSELVSRLESQRIGIL